MRGFTSSSSSPQRTGSLLDSRRHRTSGSADRARLECTYSCGSARECADGANAPRQCEDHPRRRKGRHPQAVTVQEKVSGDPRCLRQCGASPVVLRVAQICRTCSRRMTAAGRPQRRCACCRRIEVATGKKSPRQSAGVLKLTRDGVVTSVSRTDDRGYHDIREALPRAKMGDLRRPRSSGPSIRLRVVRRAWDFPVPNCRLADWQMEDQSSRPALAVITGFSSLAIHPASLTRVGAEFLSRAPAHAVN